MLAHLLVASLCTEAAFAFQIKDFSQGTSCGSSLSNYDQSFAAFIHSHGRSYQPESEEHQMRLELFKKHLSKIEQHNCKPARLWTAGPKSRFMDRTEAELAAQHGYNRRASSVQVNNGNTRLTSSKKTYKEPLPAQHNYNNLSAMQKSDIMDQAQCGSCWAFAAALTLRAHSELYTKDTKYSTQELVSCSPNPEHCGGNGGCEGSTGELAFDYVMKHGLSTEEEYPYEGITTDCPASVTNKADSMSTSGGSSIGMMGWTQLASNKVEPLQRALVEKGPVAVSVAADDWWFFYDNGIMDTCATDDPVINHLVVLVGYGEEVGVANYWEIQNSWGSSWGQDGHMKMLRTDDEESVCGMDTKPQDGVACEGEDDPVKVCGTCGILYDAVVPDFSSAGKVVMAFEHPKSQHTMPHNKAT